MNFLPAAKAHEELEERFGARYKWIALFTVALGSIAALLSSTSFNVAIPTLMQEFGLGQDKIQWAVTGFMAAMTISVLPTPWLLERFGFRNSFIGIMTLLTLSSVAGSLATEFTYLVIARVMQGAAAGMLQPLTALITMRLFPQDVRGRANGILALSIVLAPAVAPTLGGLLMDHFGWEAIFLINLPMCAIAIIAGLYLLPQSNERQVIRFDWLGVTLLGLTALSSVEAVASLNHSGLMSPWTLFYILVSISTLVGFALHAKRIPNPIARLELFKNPAFALGSIVSLICGFGIYASTYLLPVFLQSALGYSATAAGLALLPGGIVLGLMLPVAGHLADRFAPNWIASAGLAIFCLSFVLLALMGNTGYLELVIFIIIGRIGMALFLPSSTVASMNHLEQQQMSQGSMVISYTRQLGGVYGVAVSAVYLGWRQSLHVSNEAGISLAYSETFILLAVVFAIASLLACRMKNRPLEHKDAVEG